MFGFNTAVNGLLANQRSLYTVNHNISNINTEGYSRQQAKQRATTPRTIEGVGIIGTGVEIHEVSRIRDSYVDFKYWNENAPIGEWEAKMDTLAEVEKLFGEPSDSSFRQYLDDFYESLDSMSTNSGDISYREPVRENALAFTKHINESAERLQELKKETRISMETQVKTINNISKQIGALNRQIYSDEIDGRMANDLRDRRDLLVDDLSKLVNIRTDEGADGKYRVSISGISIVDHTDTWEVSLNKDEIDENKMELKWGNGSTVKLRSGELKGLLDLYNGDGIRDSYRGISYYQNKLDEFAKDFAEDFNNQHREGFGLNGESGKDFFHISDDNNVGVTITLSDDILNDLENIGAGGKSGAKDDNENLLKIIDRRETDNTDDRLKSIISNLAVDSMQSQRMHKSQNIILKNIDMKRQSISGVSYDEESADMVRFQHAYVASAKMITTMDTIMDVTINRLGLVGR